MNLFGFEDFDMATDLAEGGALSHSNDIIDIYSNSWGPFDTGYLVNGPNLLTRMALEMGVKEVCDIFKEEQGNVLTQIGHKYFWQYLSLYFTYMCKFALFI